jgi:hypothetical protein
VGTRNPGAVGWDERGLGGVMTWIAEKLENGTENKVLYDFQRTPKFWSCGPSTTRTARCSTYGNASSSGANR